MPRPGSHSNFFERPGPTFPQVQSNYSPPRHGHFGAGDRRGGYRLGGVVCSEEKGTEKNEKTGTDLFVCSDSYGNAVLRNRQQSA